MDYLIDTNIAYYLADISKDINFDIESFRKDETPKLISSISVLELYLKNDLKKFRKIMEHLNIYRIDLVVYGNEINYNDKITLKKLACKPKSYINRTIKYFEEIYLYTVSKNIMYLGFLIGGLYCFLLELKNTNKKIKELDFDFICFKNNEAIVIENIKQSIRKYFKTCNRNDSNAIYEHARFLTIMSISSYNCRNDDEKVKIKNEQKMFDKLIDLDLNCYKLMQEVCKKRGLKPKIIIQKFETSLKCDALDFSGLKDVVESIFIDNTLDWNDFGDFTLVNIAERIGHCAYITSDKHWQNFLKRYSASNKCANLSYTAICKFYKNMK